MTDSTNWIPRSLRKFDDLPLGSRFRYVRGVEVWVKLGGTDGDLIARWDGVDHPRHLQQVCAFGQTPVQRKGSFVFLATDRSVPTRCAYPACACTTSAKCADPVRTLWPGMRLDSRPGGKVIFTGRDGSEGDLEYCRRAGLVGFQEYEIESVDVFASSSLVHLKGYTGWRFNTVCFCNATRDVNGQESSRSAEAIVIPRDLMEKGEAVAAVVIPLEATDERSSPSTEDVMTRVTRSEEDRFRSLELPQSPRERLERLVLALSDAAIMVDELGAGEMARELTGDSLVYSPGTYSVDTLRVVAAWLRDIIRRSPCDQRSQLAAIRCYGCPGPRCFCNIRPAKPKEGVS
jgi:hypothetical protein